MTAALVLAHGALGPLDELLPLALSLAALVGWWVKGMAVVVHARWRDRRVSPRSRARSSR